MLPDLGKRHFKLYSISHHLPILTNIAIFLFIYLFIYLFLQFLADT